MPRNFICPLTEAPCENGRCIKGHCVDADNEKERQRKAEADKEERIERARWTGVDRYVQDELGRELERHKKGQ